MIPLLAVEIERRFGVFTLGKLPTRFPVDLLNGTIMSVLGQAEAQNFEKFNMNRQGRKPFFPADHERRAHKMIVDRVREMISRNTVRFQNNHVLIVFSNGDFPFNFVAEGVFHVHVALGFQADHVRLARFEIFVNFFFRQITALRKFAVVPW